MPRGLSLREATLPLVQQRRPRCGTTAHRDASVLLCRASHSWRTTPRGTMQEGGSAELERCMRRLDWILIILCCGAFACTVVYSKKSHAQDDHPGHREHHDVYKQWMRPDVLSSGCCDEKVWQDVNGRKWSTGHCYPTYAEPYYTDDGKEHWKVWLDDRMTVLEVPESKFLDPKKYISPNPEVAHLCEHFKDSPADPILCFLRPSKGM